LTLFIFASGNPDMAHVSTSYVERHNLSIRMGNRRFTRLTNAFSKKIDNHVHALALFFLPLQFLPHPRRSRSRRAWRRA